MKIQNTQTNLTFGSQHAIYERTVAEGLKPLGISVKAAKQEIQRLIQPIDGIQEGNGLFIFKQAKISEDQLNITLFGSHITGQHKDGVSNLAYDGNGLPVEITFPRIAGLEIIKNTVSNYLKNLKVIQNN